MTFSYDVESTTAKTLAISKIRLEIGDTSEERGVKPDGSNYTDEEIYLLYQDEDEIVGRTAARICEQLATSWSSVPRTMFGSLFDPRHVGRNYMRQSDNLRKRYGYTNDEASSFSIGMKRS